MQRPNFFLRSKLLPPRPVSDLLSRPRLTRKLQENLNAPITLVTADAGCGKTTLVSEFIRGQSREVVWYQLDYTDADPFAFLGYICQGIKRFAPKFGETILPYLGEANEELLRVPERAVDLLLNEVLETLEQPFILVLDDYHHIGRETVVHKLVDRLLQYSSDMVHLLITTRDLPPLAIVRRRSQQTALVITRDELLFTDDEMRELFRNTLNVELKPEEVAEYREKTHGWVTALQLVRQVAEGQPHEVDLKTLLRHSEKDIYDYFAEEVFAGEEPETQNLLLHLSLLDSLPLDVCSQLFPNMRSSAILPTLVQRNVFLTAAGEKASGEVYRFQPLFRDFLQRRLRTEIGRAGVAAERTRIADYFAARGNWEKALSFLLEAENFEQAARLVAERGADWIASGAITTLGIYADKIPTENFEQYPHGLVHRGEVARLQGEIEKAVTILHRAVKLLHENGDAEGEAEALHSLASIERRRGNNSAAFEYLERAEKLAASDSPVIMKCENTRGLCFVAQGDWTNAERQFRLALELAEKLSDERYIRLISHNLALPHGFRGDFGEALRFLRRMFRDGAAQLPQEAIGHLNVGRLHVYRGELTEAEPHLERALELCQLYNLRALRGEILEAYGNLYRERADFPHATEFYERARKAYDDAGVDLSTRELYEEQAQLAIFKNDLQTAKNLLENLKERRTANKNEIGLYTCRLMLCRVEAISSKFKVQISDKVAELLNYFHAHHHFYIETQAAVLLAQTLLSEGKRKEMLVPLRRALDLAARFDYDHWLKGEIRQNTTFFSDDAVIEMLPPDLRPELEREKGREEEGEKQVLQPNITPSPLHPFTPSAPVIDLTLKLLGHVEIYRDVEKPFAPDAWTTRRARDIFCYIATSRHRLVEKDVLIEEFWGEADFAAIEKNFHPTISHIRKALNSRQAYKQNFLVFRDGAYRLNPELSYSIDTEDFERLIAEAETAKREGEEEIFRERLIQAHALYRGEFMAGVYDPWAEERRGYYKEQFFRLLNGLAKISFKEKNWAQTLKYTAEILKDDPYREDVHRLVMRVLAAQGKRAAVKEHFENLASTLKKELGVEPAPETTRTFQEIFK
jgi:LuxR family transcriptional regulator, maltose regulon positive regulatory protein